MHAQIARCDVVILVSTFSRICWFRAFFSSVLTLAICSEAKSNSKSFVDNTASIFLNGFTGTSTLCTFAAFCGVPFVVAFCAGDIWISIGVDDGISFGLGHGEISLTSGGFSSVSTIVGDACVSNDFRRFSLNCTCFCKCFTSLSFKYLTIEQRRPIYFLRKFQKKRTPISLDQSDEMKKKANFIPWIRSWTTFFHDKIVSNQSMDTTPNIERYVWNGEDKKRRNRSYVCFMPWLTLIKLDTKIDGNDTFLKSWETSSAQTSGHIRRFYTGVDWIQWKRTLGDRV